MKKVTGIGGIFFKAKDADNMRKWYETHLGIKNEAYGTKFDWRDAEDADKKGYTLWAPFKAESKYFEPSEKEFMINFRVENMDELVKELQAEGITLLGEVQTYEYGKFAHIMDPEGNKIELFEAFDEE